MTEPENLQYCILERTPSPQRYHDLRQASGLTPPPLDPGIIPTALAGSWYCIIVIKGPQPVDSDTSVRDEDVVGMGRLIGDGAIFMQLVDIAVHPEHQGHGLGRMIVERLLQYADEKAPKAYISMIGDPPANEKFYPKFGFKDAKPSIGMYRGMVGWGKRGPRYFSSLKQT